MRTLIRKALVKAFAALAIAMAIVSCSGFKDISITSCAVQSIEPRGLRAVDATLSIGVHNPTMSFTITEIRGNVHDSESALANFSGGPVTIAKKSDGNYLVPCSASLGDGMSLFTFLNLARTKDFSDYLVDVAADVQLKNGLKKTLEYKDMPVNELLEKSDLTQKLFK